MKKIGILTYHYSINEGAMLQAYALQKVCQQLFTDVRVEMINYESPAAKKRDFFNCFEKISGLNSIVMNLKRWQKLSACKKDYFALSKDKLVSDNYEKCLDFVNRQNYDGIIVGSDEVWKVILGQDSVRKFPNIYWLSDRLKAKKFSYAASANKTDYKNLPFSIIKLMQDSLSSYSLIAVRDNYTQTMIKEILPSQELDRDKYFKVIDPTLLVNQIEPKSVLHKLEKHGFDRRKSTVVLNLENKRIAAAAAQFFRQRGWQIISITAYCPYADLNYVADFEPLEWASVIAQCQFSVTERFHGTIFSILGKVPFMAIEKNPRFDYFGTSKLKSLLEDLALIQNLYIYRPTEFNRDSLHQKLEFILENNDFTPTYELINSYRQAGKQYLKQVRELL